MLDGVVFHHPSSKDHDTGGGHPERPARVIAVEEALEAEGWLGCEVRESPVATREQLVAVHPGRHVTAIEELCASGGGWIDGDTVVSEASFVAASHAAGGVVALAEELLGPSPRRIGASVHRPPGHHAESGRAMGFCLFNNVAVAARHVVDSGLAERVLILDWDVHHGNGTNDIFHASPDVLFASIHQSPLYPGTGPAGDIGSGPGVGYTVNLPVPPGSGDARFCSLVEHVVVPLGRAYAPGLLLISAGFDAHFDDPLAECEVTDAGYAAMASSMRRLADELGVPLGIVLEGGYDLGALSRGMVSALSAALADAPPPAPDADELPVDPLAARACEQHAKRWPALAS